MKTTGIIVAGLPGLEWMTENLSGFGGTEVGGHTYYTYGEAVAAVKALGGGWRLPARGEMLDLDNLGSEWQENGPHGLPGRLFGGGLFIPAAGYRNGTGALANVGTEGDCWSSSSGVSGSYYAALLYFYTGSVDPLNGWCRASASSVRCVRNVK